MFQGRHLRHMNRISTKMAVNAAALPIDAAYPWLLKRATGDSLPNIRCCDMHKLHAVALAERSAALVSFQWQ